MFLKKLRLTQKLIFAFGLISILTILEAVVVWNNVVAVDEHVARINERLVPQNQRISDLSRTIYRASLETRHAMLMRTEAKREAAISEITRLKLDAERLINELRGGLSSEEGKRRLAIVLATQEGFWSAAGEVVPLIRGGQIDAAVDMLEEKVVPARNKFLAAIDHQQDWQKQLLDTVSKDALARGLETERLILLVATLTALAGVLIAVFLARHLMRQLGGEPADAVAAVRAVADGDLTQRIDVRHGDNTSIMSALSGMQMKLTSLVGQVRLGIDSVATASSQIAAGNSDLSSRTEQQAAGLEQTTSSMQEMTDSVRANADSAKQANVTVGSASLAAAAGGEVFSKVVATMADIQASSKRIGEIVGTIDGIAFQTNILALNAAVEAARAGEAGRGFAVVASEVRALAQRCTVAAREVKTLINTSVEGVSNGNRLVVDAGTHMQEIVTQINHVRTLISEIATASEQQSQGIEQVGSAIGQIDQTTQQNAALVEQSAAAAASLKQQAAQLAEAIAAFRVETAPSRLPVAA
jgi:methyl-accepting chemotaxis protein